MSGLWTNGMHAVRVARSLSSVGTLTSSLLWMQVATTVEDKAALLAGTVQGGEVAAGVHMAAVGAEVDGSIGTYLWPPGRGRKLSHADSKPR